MKIHINEKNVKISGRTLFRNEICYLGYSASSVSFNFTGKKASAVIISNPDEVLPENYAWIGIYINNSQEPVKRIELSQTSQEVLLYESSETSTVNITIMKYTEPEYAICGIKYIETDSDSMLAPPPPKKRRIQIIGDSITCGYGVEGNVDELEFKTAEENPAKSYSVRTAMQLDADFEIIAWNGKGVISAYIGDEDVPPDKSWLVPMLYNYTDAGLCNFYFHEEKEKWEKWQHNKFEPDIITIYLGTNDSSYTREIPERDSEFISGYVEFLKELHGIHPNAAILCMLGTMDQRLCPAVEKAARQFKNENSDVNISYLQLPMQLDEDGIGTFWHPSSVTQEKTAKIVVEKIKEMMKW